MTIVSTSFFNRKTSSSSSSSSVAGFHWNSHTRLFMEYSMWSFARLILGHIFLPVPNGIILISLLPVTLPLVSRTCPVVRLPSPRVAAGSVPAGGCVRRPSKITAFRCVAFSRSYSRMHRSIVPVTSSISFFCNSDCLTRFAMIHRRTVVVVSAPPLWNSEHKLTTSPLLSFLPSPSDNSRWRRV
ncbi:unnamed protein product [Musa textilis]